jgi:hypothetical protein
MYKVTIQRQTQEPKLYRWFVQGRWPGGTVYREVLQCWCLETYKTNFKKARFRMEFVTDITRCFLFVVRHKSTLQ